MYIPTLLYTSCQPGAGFTDLLALFCSDLQVDTDLFLQFTALLCPTSLHILGKLLTGPYCLHLIRSNLMYCLRPGPFTRATGFQGPIPLTQVSFASVIRDAICRTEVSQVYRNVESNPIECEYVFPVLQDAALMGLKVQTDDGAVLEARIEDLEEAKEGYSDAIASGDQAVMGRMETEDRMVLNVGNMAPKSKVKVTFTLVHPVKCEGKDWSFLLPAALIPLFDLGKSLESLGIAEDEDDPSPTALTFVRPSNCTYKLGFRLVIHSSSPISHCECRSHVVVIDNAAPHLQATICTNADSKLTANKDFRVIYETADAMVPQVKVQYDPKTQEYAAMLAFLPPLLDPGEEPEELTGTGELLLLLDRSGSMQGSRIDTAREATLLFIKSLPPGCLFNVISFGTGMEKLFPNSVPYNGETVEKAARAVSTFMADMNGTNILNPLQAALALTPNPLFPRSIFLLTDGAVSNKDAVISLVEGQAKNVRVHAFGIGDGVSTELVIGVANAGNGIAEFIANPADVKAKVINVLQKSLAPALTNNTLNWHAQTSQYPSNERLPTCYFGEVFRVFAHFGTSPPPLGTPLTLSSCNSKTGQDVSFEVVIGPDMAEGDSIHLLWAKQAIKEKTYFAKTTGNAQAKIETIQVSKKFGIPSMYTAFLCIESRADPVTGAMQLRKVPVVSVSSSMPSIPSASFGAMRLMKKCKASVNSSQPKGFQSVARSGCAPKAMSLSSSSVQKESNIRYMDTRSMDTRYMDTRQDECERAVMKPAAARMRAEESKGAGPVTSALATYTSSLMQLVQTQQVDGYWSPSALTNILRSSQCPEAIRTQYSQEAEEIWATICAVLVLRLKYASEEGEWKLLAGKAKRWLKARGIAEVAEYSDLISSLIIA